MNANSACWLMRTSRAPRSPATTETPRGALSSTSISPTLSPSLRMFVRKGGPVTVFAPTLRAAFAFLALALGPVPLPSVPVCVSWRYTPKLPLSTMYIPLDESSPWRNTTTPGSKSRNSAASLKSSRDSSSSRQAKNLVLAKKFGVDSCSLFSSQSESNRSDSSSSSSGSLDSVDAQRGSDPDRVVASESWEASTAESFRVLVSKTDARREPRLSVSSSNASSAISLSSSACRRLAPGRSVDAASFSARRIATETA
mmetsp:Transcript_4882/g.18093  ORF Transcript_4882/g.18093 Transcript_4882/m.18093 type:complete len:256 (-) Transcript_4882:249-1016(-)